MIFYTLSAYALITGGAFATAAWLGLAIFDPGNNQYQNPLWGWLNFCEIAGGVLMAMGLPGLYASQAEQTGIAGLIGFILLFVGIVIPYVGVHSIQTATFPDVPSKMMRWVSIGAPSIWLGIIVTGYSTWQAGVYPPAAGITLIVSAFAGLATVIRTLPQRLQIGSSAAFTLTMIYMGTLLLRIP